jgi:hypothetical protein
MRLYETGVLKLYALRKEIPSHSYDAGDDAGVNQNTGLRF